MRLAHFLTDSIHNKLSIPGGTSIGRSIAKKLLPRLTAPIICPTTLGFDLVVSKDDGNNYYYDGFYEIGTLQVMSDCLEPGDTFLDIGASVGQMSLHASTLVGKKGKVLAFEPHPQRYNSLIEAITINQRTNVTAYQTGLGEVEDELKLYTDRVSPSLMADGEHDGTYESVRVLKLDSVLRNENTSTVRMIKIDVEGFELNVLRGASELLSSPDAPIICMEHEVYASDTLASLRYLSEINKYQFFNLTRTKTRVSKLRKVNRLEDVRLRDNVFCFTANHLDQLTGRELFEY